MWPQDRYYCPYVAGEEAELQRPLVAHYLVYTVSERQMVPGLKLTFVWLQQLLFSEQDPHWFVMSMFFYSLSTDPLLFLIINLHSDFFLSSTFLQGLKLLAQLTVHVVSVSLFRFRRWVHQLPATQHRAGLLSSQSPSLLICKMGVTVVPISQVFTRPKWSCM